VWGGVWGYLVVIISTLDCPQRNGGDRPGGSPQSNGVS